MKKGTAQTAIFLKVGDDEFDVEVQIAAVFHCDWEFENDDISFDEEFDEWREKIINRVRLREHQLTFIPNDV